MFPEAMLSLARRVDGFIPIEDMAESLPVEPFLAADFLRAQVLFLPCLYCLSLFVTAKTPRKPASLLGLAKSKGDKKGVKGDKKRVER